MSSLKEQLLKSGLINKKQSQQTHASQKKTEHDAKKNKDLATQLAEEKQKEFKSIEAEKEKRRFLDLELNKKRDQMILERENFYRCQQLIHSQALQPASSPFYYFFREGHFVRKIPILPWQNEWIVRGKFSIARIHPDVDEFFLIPRYAATKVQDFCPQMVLVFYSEISDNTEIQQHILEEPQ